jgi:23S rRNA pseudouridine955/2504/2580 synthase
MPSVEIREIGTDEAGLRLDRWFRRHFPDVPQARLQKWLRTGQVRLDGHRVTASERVTAGQRVRIPPFDDAARPASAESERPGAPLRQADVTALRERVLYRDDHVLVIDKSAGLAVQGGTGTHRHLDGMLDALAFDGARPRLVHRLDRDTSGVLLLARSASAAAALTAAFRGRRIRKIYWAIVVGVPEVKEGRITVPLDKRRVGGGERVVAGEGGQSAVTVFTVLERAGDAVAWLELEPLTGRTHQLRAHCLALGTPILGDGKYGGAAAFLSGDQSRRRLHLHARSLTIPHPAGGTLVVEAALPDALLDTWRFFGFDPAPPSRPLRTADAMPETACQTPRRGRR